MIRLDLTREQAEALLNDSTCDIPGLRERYESSRARGFITPQRIKFYLSDTVACGVVRADEIVRCVNQHGFPHSADCKAITTPSDIANMTCAVIQRQRHPKLGAFLKRVRGAGKRVIYDIDDDLFNVPPELDHVHKTYADPKVQEAIRDIMLSCDEVVAATPYLAAEVSRQLDYRKPVRVIPNYIDTDVWYPVLPKVQEPLIVGWMASGTHAADCQLLESVMPQIQKEFGDKVLVEVIGNVPAKALDRWQVSYTQLPWIPYEELPLTMSRWSVGLCPLRDTRFNRSKSPIKALQYWGLKIPVVCSRMEAYVDVVDPGVNGLLATGVEEWTDMLMALLKDVDLRTRLADNGYETVKKSFDLKHKVWNWIQAAAGR